MFKNFNEMLLSMSAVAAKTLVVAAAHDRHTLEAVFAAQSVIPLDYILTGDRERIRAIADDLGHEVGAGRIVDADGNEDCARKAVAMIKDNAGDALMKGILETGTLMKAVLDKDTGIRGSGVMSHLAMLESPLYHKLLAVTDGGMIPHPDLAQKIAIIVNAVNFYKRLGVSVPKAAALAASETVSPKMPETAEAAELAAMSADGRLGDVLLEGPLSFDIAISRQAAETKGFDSRVSGDADILLTPDITAGNILCKGLIYLGGAKMAGCVLGAAVPVVLVSRGASAEEKTLSIMMCLCDSK